jgi:hypothetical protein
MCLYPTNLSWFTKIRFLWGKGFPGKTSIYLEKYMKKPLQILITIEEVIAEDYVIPMYLLRPTINCFYSIEINGKVIKKKYEKV